MGNFSRDTFNKLKHYVGVRLQQGVPIVDADWNEQEDIRKYELQAFIKWFVGDGVPRGNDGFRIMPVAEENDFIIVGGEGTTDGAGRCLVNGWDVLNENNLRYSEQPLYNNNALADTWQVPHLPTLNTPAAGESRTDVVYLDVWEREVNASDAPPTGDPELINDLIGLETCVRVKREWVVRVAEGANTPPASPEGHVHYPLAWLNRAGGRILAGQISDRRLTGLSMPSYRDIQQIVTDAYGPSYTLDQDGRPNLKVSLRDAINAILRGDLPSTPEIALVTETAIFYYEMNLYTDIMQDSVGNIWLFWYSIPEDYYHYDEFETKVWVKHYRRADDSWGPDTELIVPPSENNRFFRPQLKHLEDNDGNLWLFWQMVGEEESNYHVWYKSYLRSSGVWEDEARLTTASEYENILDITLDDDGNLWVFWRSQRNDNNDIRAKRYLQSSGVWENEARITTASEPENFQQTMIDNDGNLWVFWRSQRNNNYDIWYRRYLRSGGNWENESRVTTASESEAFLRAMTDNDGNVWVFWYSTRDQEQRIRYRRFLSASDTWEDEDQFSSIYTSDFQITTDIDGGIWVFWRSTVNNNANIRYRYYNQESNSWEHEYWVTSSAEQDYTPFPMVDSRGDIWVFWRSNRNGNYDIWYRRIVRTSPNTFSWGAETELTSESTQHASLAQVTEDNRGDIWAFWSAGNTVWYKRFSQSGGWSRTFQLSITENIDFSEVFPDDAGDLWIFWEHSIYSAAGTVTFNIVHKRLIPTI